MHRITLRHFGIPAAALSLVLGAAAFRAGPDTPGSRETRLAVTDTSDVQVVNFLMQANQEEISAARQVLQSAQNEKVRRFAQKMIDDHSAALSKLQSIASRLGVQEVNPSDSAPHRPDMAVPSTDSIRKSDSSGVRPDSMHRMGQDSMHRMGTRCTQDSTTLPKSADSMPNGGMRAPGDTSTSNRPYQSNADSVRNHPEQSNADSAHNRPYEAKADSMHNRRDEHADSTRNRRYEPSADTTRGYTSGGANVNDASYISEQITDHQRVLSQLKEYKSGIKDNELKLHVVEVTKKVQEHLKLAKRIQSQLGNNS